MKKPASKTKKAPAAQKAKKTASTAKQVKPKKKVSAERSIEQSINLTASVVTLGGGAINIIFTDWGSVVIRIGEIVGKHLSFLATKGTAIGVDAPELAYIIASVPARMLLVQTLAAQWSEKITGKRVRLDDKLINDLANAIVESKSNDYFEGAANAAFKRLILELNLPQVDPSSAARRPGLRF